jgi:acetylornithine deacetylase/succinyl-diaminopimelate desuccinylase-like protein
VRAVRAFLERPARQRAAVERLARLVRIPSVSGSRRHRDDVDRAAVELAFILRAIGMQRVELVRVASGAPPHVCAEWRGPVRAPTVLFYGHYDVQPPGPRAAWRTGPFDAVVADGCLHGRGASDDKGQLLTHIGALEAWLRGCGRLPVNVKVWLEGEEEIGSPNVAAFLDREAARIRCDAAVVSDTQMLGDGRPSIVYGLRGLASVELAVTGPERDVHDGLFGGAAPNPVHELARVVTRLHDAGGRVTVPGFYDPVRTPAAAQRSALRRAMATDDAYSTVMGAAPVGECGWSAAERIAVRPALNVTAIAGGQTHGRPRSVVPASAWARFNARLVPDQDPRTVGHLVARHVRSLVAPPFRARARLRAAADAVELPTDHAVVTAAATAAAATFGTPPAFVRSGGSIPAVAALRRQFGIPVVLLGFGLPSDSIHAANERFPLVSLHRGTATIARFLSECAP